MQSLRPVGQFVGEFRGNKHAAHRIARRLSTLLRLATTACRALRRRWTALRRPEDELAGSVQESADDDDNQKFEQVDKQSQHDLPDSPGSAE